MPAQGAGTRQLVATDLARLRGQGLDPDARLLPALAQPPVRLLVGEAAGLSLVAELLQRRLRLRALALQLPHLERGLVGRDLLGQDLRLAHQPLLGQLLVASSPRSR